MNIVEVEKLKVGMVLSRTVTDSRFVVILSENTVLNEKHIAALKAAQVPAVHIKDEYELSKLFQQVASISRKDSSFTNNFERVAKLAEKVFTEIKSGGEIKTPVVLLTAQILPMVDNPASTNYLFTLSHRSTSLALHGERVAIFAGIIAKWMNFSWDEIRVLMIAAFLHDVGKFKFPQTLLAKTEDELNAKEMLLHRSHPSIGAALLRKLKFTEPIPTIIMQHHEHVNGSGFPQKIHGAQMHLFAKIIAVADAYDNLIIERPGFVKKTPFDAVNYLLHNQYTRYDPAVCVPFITRLKDNLVGSAVTLSDGRIGRVVFYPKDFSSMPVIALDDGTQINLNRSANLSIVEYHIT